MEEKIFWKYLLKNNISQEKRAVLIFGLNKFNKFLKKENMDNDSTPSGEEITYI
ncbi:MAG: hypothetical protein ACFFB0_07135 [Promethearchaeota archaeon]